MLLRLCSPVPGLADAAAAAAAAFRFPPLLRLPDLVVSADAANRADTTRQLITQPDAAVRRPMGRLGNGCMNCFQHAQVRPQMLQRYLVRPVGKSTRRIVVNFHENSIAASGHC